MLVLESKRRHRRLWKLLLNPLMWSSLIEIDQIRLEKTMELLLMENQEMIQAFSPHAAQKAFAHGIRSWRPVRRS
jgi:hypothetical protein